MDELRKFLKLLRKKRYTLVCIPLLSIAVTYFLVRNMASSYMSEARIATGLLEDSHPFAGMAAGLAKGSELTLQFSNIVETMRMKRILDQVSYKLIIHDLTSSSPFRKPSSKLADLKPEVRKRALKIFLDKYNKNQELNLWNKEEELLFQVLKSMEYDSNSLDDKLKVYRAGDSDFINVDFESENPRLSAFVANYTSTEFVKYYTVLKKANQVKTNAFFKSLLKEKKDILNKAVDSLRSYKIRNRVLNLDDQSSQLYAQILDYNNRKQDVLKSIASNAGALSEIDRKFDPSQRKYLESALTRLNQRILDTRQELQALYDQYIQSNFDEQYKASIDSLQNILTGQINKSNDTYAYNPLTTKEALVQQKLNLEVQLDLSKYSMSSIEKELSNLNAQLDQLVPHEALVQALDRDIGVASQEYLDVLAKYNQSSLESGLSIKLRLVENAMPGTAQSSKKMLIVILAGLLSLIFCISVLFVIYFFDNSINSPRDLSCRSGLRVLGDLAMIDQPRIELQQVWDNRENSAATAEFKDELRAIRFEIESLLKGKIIAVSSMMPQEGKTLLTVCLTYAFKMINRKVLIIDGDFSDPSISATSTSDVYLEDFFNGKRELKSNGASSVTVLKNRGGDTSIFEICEDREVRDRLSCLKDQFDIILIETPALSDFTPAKEWISVSDHVVTVFESGQSLSEKKLHVIQYLKGLGDKHLGWVLNKVKYARRAQIKKKVKEGK